MSTEKKKKLTAKERLFCENYLINFNGRDSAIKAGYSEHTASEIAYENLRKPHIKKYLELRTEEILNSIGVNQVRVISEIANIAFSNITDFVQVDEMEIKKGRKKVKVKYANVLLTKDVAEEKRSVISEIKQTAEGISIKVHDKVSALEKLGRYLKLFTEKVDVTTKGKALPTPVTEKVIKATLKLT